MQSARAPISRALCIVWGPRYPLSLPLLPAVVSQAERGPLVELVWRGHVLGLGLHARLYLSQPPKHGKWWPDRRHLSSFLEGDNRLGFAERHGLHRGPHGNVSCRSPCSWDDRADAAGTAVSHLARCPAHHCLHRHQGEWPSLLPAALQGCCRMAEVLLCTSLFMSACPSINLSRSSGSWQRDCVFPSPLVPPRNAAEAFSSVMIINGVFAPGIPPSASRTGLPGAHRASRTETGSVCVRAVQLSQPKGRHACLQCHPAVQAVGKRGALPLAFARALQRVRLLETDITGSAAASTALPFARPRLQHSFTAESRGGN